MAAEPNDPFMSIAHGRYPLSENLGAATKWLGEDGIPRPDRRLWLLKTLAVIGGPLGLDHFYLRSPLTGIAKMLTFGGIGLWWIWDVCQVFGEEQRVLNYGMTTPFDYYTGIGQGMITEESQYGPGWRYPAWLVGVLFGFAGLDSLAAPKSQGQFLRKALEFALLVVSVYYAVNLSDWFWKIAAILAAAYLGPLVLVEYFNLIKLVFGGELFTKGYVYNVDDDEEYNSLMRSVINATILSDEKKEEVIKNLQYGGISVSALKKMFGIKHSSEDDDVIPPMEWTAAAASAGPAWSFILFMLSPFLILANWCWMFAVLVYPPLGIAAEARRAQQNLMSAATGGLMGAATNPSSLASGLMGAATGGLMGAATNPSSLASGLMGAATGGLMTGGARHEEQKEPMSTEAQVMGAALIAIIAGGSLKGLIDYLTAE